MNVSEATPAGEGAGRMAYNYAIVGVQKGGTSTLAVTLNQHRLVCQPPDKERHYFDDEEVDWSAPDYARDYTAPRRAPVHRLVGDALRDRQEVHVALRDAHILGLAAGEAAREVRVAEEAGVAVAVHGVHERRRVCAVAERGELLLAVLALAARDLEGRNDAVADPEVRDVGPDLVDDAHELCGAPSAGVLCGL